MKKHFVTFYSPGTFVPEETVRPVDKWDVDAAVDMARTVKERYGAKPYAFRFSTRSRGEADLDSRVSERSPLYYLGGKVETAQEVIARNDPKEEILRANIRSNKIKQVIINDNSWRFIGAFNKGDVLLDVTL